MDKLKIPSSQVFIGLLEPCLSTLMWEGFEAFNNSGSVVFGGPIKMCCNVVYKSQVMFDHLIKEGRLVFINYHMLHYSSSFVDSSGGGFEDGGR